MGIINWIFSKNRAEKAAKPAPAVIQTPSVVKVGFINLAEEIFKGYAGSKTGMSVGFGLTEDLRCVNLRLLQFRSLQLARQNSFASTVFNLLETKIINGGLKLKSHPLESILEAHGIKPEGFADQVECLWEIWTKDKRLVTAKKNMTFGELERVVYRTTKISGDCLIIRSFNKLGLPVIEIVDGINVVQPPITNGGDIIQGVEHDKRGIEVAYYIGYGANEAMPVKVPAFDSRGQRRAWLVRSTEKRIDERRGLPLLAAVMQNINEIGKYLDSEQRAAVVNSVITVVHKKDPNAPLRPNPFTDAGRETYVEQPGASPLTFKEMQPGFIMSNLASGEDIHSFDTSRPNVNFGKFYEVVSKAMSSALGIPPECLFLEFNSNYSASRQAKLEFEDFAKKELAIFTDKFEQPIFEDWLDGMILAGRIKASGYVESINDESRFDILGAWRSCSWRGLPKSNVDGLKQAKELEIIEAHGWMEPEQIADEFFDTDLSANINAIARINAKRKKNGLAPVGIVGDSNEDTTEE